MSACVATPIGGAEESRPEPREEAGEQPTTCTPRSPFVDASVHGGLGLLGFAHAIAGRFDIGMLANRCQPDGTIDAQLHVGVGIGVEERRVSPGDKTGAQAYRLEAEAGWRFGPVRVGPIVAVGFDHEATNAPSAELGGRLRIGGFWLGADAVYRMGTSYGFSQTMYGTQIGLMFTVGVSSEGSSAAPWSYRPVWIAAGIGLGLDLLLLAALSGMH